MKEMALAALSRGMEHICFTDHCDLEHYETGAYDPLCLDKDRLLASFEEAFSACADKISLCLGIELGGGGHMPDRANEILACLKPDFVIGSVHNLAGMPDFYMYGRNKGQFENGEQCAALLGQYVGELFDLTELSDFDVLGHIGYPLRYIKREGFDLDLRGFTAELRSLFRLLREKGRGIEVNTAGWRNEYKKLMPSPEILKLYKEESGEIITLGSDAHDTQSAGAGIKEACELLKQTGFRYFTVFRGREPEFIKL